MHNIKIINWNIGNSSLERLPRQISYLIEKKPDIIILTEVGNTEKIENIKGIFGEFDYNLFSNDNYLDNYAVIILVNNLFNSKLCACDHAYSRNIAVKTDMYGHKLIIVGTYFPSNNRKLLEKKMNHYKNFLNLLDSIEQENIIISGDFNSVKESHTPRFTWFRKWEYEIFINLENRNFIDVCSVLNEKQYSWYGNKGIGHLYDYCFLSEPLFKKIVTCEYDQNVREKKLSDHALQYIEINLKELVK